jgi:hypothetical protein
MVGDDGDVVGGRLPAWSRLVDFVLNGTNDLVADGADGL